MRRIKVGLSDAAISRVDSIRGDVPRERWIRRLIEDRIWRGLNPATPQGVKREKREPATVKDSVADVAARLDPPTTVGEVMAQVPGLVPASSLKTQPPANGDAQDQTITDEPSRQDRPW